MPSIKIIKVIRDLNVGLESVVDFLKKKGVDVDSNPNAKISLDALQLCVNEFAKNLSSEERETLINKYKEPKSNVAPPVTLVEKKDVSTTATPTQTIVKGAEGSGKEPKGLVIKGHIDLNPKKAKGTAKVESKENRIKSDPVARKPVEKSPKKVETPDTVATKKEVTPKPIEEVIPATKSVPKTEEKKEPSQPSKEKTEIKVNVVSTPIAEEKKEDKKPAPTLSASAPKSEPLKDEVLKETSTTPKVEAPQAIQSEAPAEDTIFRLHNTVAPVGPKVIGKVDLSTLNTQSNSSKRGDRKKRKRINSKKVDVSKEQKSTDATPRQNSSKANAGGVKTGSAQQRNNAKQEKGRKAKRQQQIEAKQEISQEDIQKQIKETLAQMQSKSRRGTAQAAKYRRDKREAHRKEQDQIERQISENRTLQLTEYVTANDLAQMMDLPVTEIITMCFNIGMMVSINQRLEKETIDLILDEYGYTPEYVEAQVLDAIQEEEDAEEDLLPRAPIVTVMGHVDHGKTSLLDAIRNSNVIGGEAGGITQHVGAYSVTLENGRKITFLDTPGHEAFTAMRARGAKVTDVVIIVVAADDGVMPQTKEAINHAAIAGVPIIFAINKVDKPHANPEKIKEELSAMNYLVEDWGGKYQSQNISAKKNIGIHELLEKVLLEADMLELKANPNKRATGSVLESTMEVGRGYTTKVLIQEGTLHVGDYILAGTYYGRVKALFNERGNNVTSVGPSDPVKVLGLNGAAQAGEAFNVLETEQEVRDIASKRTQLKREQRERTQRIPTLENLSQRIADGGVKELNVIVKGDVDGSVEALSDSVVKLSTSEVRVNVIHKAVGQISESDVVLAAASNAVIIGFQVRPATAARKSAENEGVEIRTYSIIYDAIDDVKQAMEGMLSPEIRESVTATVEVREIFKISRVGTIAGCMVKEGKISRSDKVRVIRDGIVIFTGELGSLKRFKDDVKDVNNGYECGLNVQGFNDVMVGDIIESYEEIKVKKKL